MKPSDVRNLSWAEVQGRLTADRQRVYAGLGRFGVCTTRVLAGFMGMDVLSVRPRITELCELGLVECVGVEGREGLYASVPLELAQRRWDERQGKPEPEQMRLI